MSPDSQIRAICCHFSVTYSAFNFTKLKPRRFHKLSVVLISHKVFLKIQQTTGKLSSCVHDVISLLSTDEFIISQCILLQFRKLMKSICPPDANSIHIKFQWQQIVDKLKIIHAVQFVLYAKSHLAIWEYNALRTMHKNKY